MNEWTRDMIEAHNARVEAGNKRHENNPRPEIPNAEQRQRTKALARNGDGEAQGAGCPHVCFTLRRVKLLDVDAKYASCKDVIDGLQYAGLIHSDKEGELVLEVRQEKVSSYSLEETQIEITI